MASLAGNHVENTTTPAPTELLLPLDPADDTAADAEHHVGVGGGAADAGAAAVRHSRGRVHGGNSGGGGEATRLPALLS